VEKDIINFIKVAGTGQEIPDPPKFIEFCREDANDAASEASEGASYKVAQFPRPINPATRPGAASPQPSVLESHHDPTSALARELGGIGSSPGQATAGAELPDRLMPDRSIPDRSMPDRTLPNQQPQSGHQSGPYGQPKFANSWADVQKVPHNNEYAQDSMSRYSRSGPPPLNPSDISSSSVSYRPGSRDSQSEVSALSGGSFTSYEASNGNQSPVKQMNDEPSKKSPWYKSPFSRSKGQESKESTPTPTPVANPRNTWGVAAGRKAGHDNGTPTRPFGRGPLFQNPQPSSPDPVDPHSKIQLNVGNNVFDVSPDSHRRPVQQKQNHRHHPQHDSFDPTDPLEQALADLSDITASKVPQDRSSTDHHFGLRTPVPGMPLAGAVQTPLAAAQRGTPPPAYNNPAALAPANHLGAPPAAHTARDMHAAKNRYLNQRRDVYDPSSPSSPSTAAAAPQPRHSRSQSAVRATSPAPLRATSPRPGQPAGAFRPPGNNGSQGYGAANNNNNNMGGRGGGVGGAGGGYAPRATSPNPYAQAAGQQQRARANSTAPQQAGGGGGGYGGGGSWGSRSGGNGMPPRAVSPMPPQQHPHQHPHQQHQQHQQGYAQPRPGSRMAGGGGGGGEMSVALHASGGSEFGGSVRGRARPQSQYYPAGGEGGQGQGQGQVSTRVRSRSVAAGREYTKDGRPILHFGMFFFLPFRVSSYSQGSA
jgi:hypothetical protein